MNIDSSWHSECEKMVQEQCIARGIANPRVLDSLRRIPRHCFVPAGQRGLAYSDQALAIGLGATISQPYVVAFMTELIRPYPGMRALEIGTGSGYQSAILAACGAQILSLEIQAELAAGARKRLSDLQLDNQVLVLDQDGAQGYAPGAPYDAVVFTCSLAEVPAAVINQVAHPDGCLVAPIGPAHAAQILRRGFWRMGRFVWQDCLDVRFVPLV
jgi:protein-L-isoaspartate(D-aspartate) O-methyltransferase